MNKPCLTARPVTIAVAEAVITALMALRAEHGDNLQIYKQLHAMARQLLDQLTGPAAIQELCQGRGVRMRLGHSNLVEVGTRACPPLAMPTAVTECLSCGLNPATPGLRPQGTSNTPGDANL